MSIESTCGWRRCCPSGCCGFYCLLEKRLCAGPCRVYAPLQRTRKTFLYKRSHPDLIHESVVMPRPCIWSAITPPSKTPAPFELEFHMATRPHARTKRNDFPVGVTPQPPMLLIYDSVTHYASSNRMICCTYPCVHYSFKLAAIIACCALLGGLTPCLQRIAGRFDPKSSSTFCFAILLLLNLLPGAMGLVIGVMSGHREIVRAAVRAVIRAAIVRAAIGSELQIEPSSDEVQQCLLKVRPLHGPLHDVIDGTDGGDALRLQVRVGAEIARLCHNKGSGIALDRDCKDCHPYLFRPQFAIVSDALHFSWLHNPSHNHATIPMIFLLEQSLVQRVERATRHRDNPTQT